MKLTERQKLLLESASDWIQSNYPEADLVGTKEIVDKILRCSERAAP